MFSVLAARYDSSTNYLMAQAYADSRRSSKNIFSVFNHKNKTKNIYKIPTLQFQFCIVLRSDNKKCAGDKIVIFLFVQHIPITDIASCSAVFMQNLKFVIPLPSNMCDIFQ
jgi:hypothetical protein